MTGRLEWTWASMWNEASRHYAARSIGRRLPRIAVGDIEAMPLYRGDDGENVAITLSRCELEGLGTIQGHGIHVTPRRFEAELSFPALTLSGRYALSGEHPLRGGIEAALHAAAPTSVVPFRYMSLARQNRATLLQTSNGQSLVGTYYDNTDAMSSILTQTNAFTIAWPVGAPSNGPTSSYMAITADAAESSSYSVGDEAYWFQAAYMQTILTKTSLGYANGSTDAANEYNVLANAIATFNDQTSPYGSAPMTVDQVYQAVNSSASTVGSSSPTPPMRRGIEMAERDYPVLEAQAAEIRAREDAARKRRGSRGRFAWRVPAVVAVLRGTPRDGGTVTSLEAIVPPPATDLQGGSDPLFTKLANERLAGAEWLRRFLSARIAARLRDALVAPLSVAWTDAAAGYADRVRRNI